jgi:hypothetical protein
MSGSAGGPARLSRTVAIWLIVVAVPGFIVTLVLNAFFLDDYDAYGEVSVPGSASLHLPRGAVTISLHAEVIGSPNGGLPVPPMGVTIVPPNGVNDPAVTEDIGGTTTVNNDAHVRVWVARSRSTAPTTSPPTARSAASSTPDWPSATAVRSDSWSGCSSDCSPRDSSGCSWRGSGRAASAARRLPLPHRTTGFQSAPS